MRACEVTMPQAVLATINPPAIFSTGSEMPKKYSTKRPKKRNVTRMTKTQMPGLERGATPILRSPGRGHGEEDGNAAEGIDDRKQRKERCRRRSPAACAGTVRERERKSCAT